MVLGRVRINHLFEEVVRPTPSRSPFPFLHVKVDLTVYPEKASGVLLQVRINYKLSIRVYV